ncbi:enoyl-CoA hydratase/isomerase family protein [Thalassotalea euphylliae]|uniref:enoyl-CoA hydratase/isomerase family protein n=1 Tax=Thalassotalea euphylliae TaxID=1655234 RepID=UPI003633F578
MNALNLSAELAAHIDTEITDSVLIIKMTQPNRLNGWTMPMMEAFKKALSLANSLDDIKAIVFTGEGRYYSAGVNLSSAIQLMHPKKLHGLIVEHNQSLFEAFLNVRKPILAAINGPAIGASVTSATLCNGVIAAKEATFSTPFAALGVTPEGCSSIHFPRLMGEENAQRMLGSEGWKPTAEEALAIGIVQHVVPQEELLPKAIEIAKGWINSNQERAFLAGSTLPELIKANIEESEALATAFLSRKFLMNQAKFLWSKKKRGIAVMFFVLATTQPIWARMK